MKTLFAFLIIFITEAYGQYQLPKAFTTTENPIYKPVTLYTGVDAAVGDTSAVWEIPSGVTGGIVVVHADTVTTADSLKSMYIQDSPDNLHWYNNTLIVSAIHAGIGRSGTLIRKALDSAPGSYIRFIFTIYGTNEAIDFTAKFYPTSSNTFPTTSYAKTYLPLDTIPEVFTFPDITGAALGSYHTSNAITLTGFDSCWAYCAGDSFKVNSGSLQVHWKKVYNNDVIHLTTVASTSYLTAVNKTLSVAGLSDVYSVTTKADNDAPATPTGLAATGGDGEVVFTWDANTETDLAGYILYGGLATSPTDSIAFIAKGTETYDVTDLGAGVTYYGRLKARDTHYNYSAYTSTVHDDTNP